MEVRLFTIHVPDDVLDDLRQRLGHTRFPDEIPGSEWDYGSNLEYLKALVHYWRTDFDWRAQEAQLNRWHHYQTPVDGLNIQAQYGFQGVDKSPALQGDLPYLGHLFARSQWAILAS